MDVQSGAIHRDPPLRVLFTERSREESELSRNLLPNRSNCLTYGTVFAKIPG